MHDIENKLGASLIQSIRKPTVGLIGQSIDLLTQLPISAVLSELAAMGNGVADYWFSNRLVRFIQATNAMPEDERNQKLDEFFTDENHRNKFAGKIIEILKRFDDARKATILGNASLGLLKRELTELEFWRLSRSVDTLSLDEDWRILIILEDYRKEFYSDGQQKDFDWDHKGVFLSMVQKRYSPEMEEEQLSSIMWNFLNSGLFGPPGWQHGPAHDSDFSPLYFKLKKYVPDACS